MAYLVDFNSDFGNYTLQFRKKMGIGPYRLESRPLLCILLTLKTLSSMLRKGKVHCALFHVCPYVHLLYVSETLYNSRNQMFFLVKFPKLMKTDKI